MPLSRIIEILRARWRAALLVLATALGLAVIVSLLLPRQYKATASVLVDMRSPDPLAGTVLGSVLITGYMATQMDLVQSERVARRAIGTLDLEHDRALKERWQDATEGRGDYGAWLAEQLQRKLDVQPTRESGVMTINFTATDPQVAAATANAFMRAYIDTTLELRVEPAKRYSDFFDERSKQLRLALEDAQAKLSAYQQANGIVGTDERLDVENMRLAELSSQLVALQATSAESGSREQQASVNADRMTEVFSHPAVAALNAELSRQQLRLGELRQRLGDQHPQVQEVENGIAQLRSQIASETRRVSAGMGVSNQVNRARETQLRALLAAQRARVLRLKSQRDEANVLQRDVENARIAYDTVQQRARQSGLESHMTQTNVSVLREATAPATASSPKLWSNVAVALVVGALLAVAAVLVRELNDRRMRTVEDVVDGLKQHLLVVLPRASAQTSPRVPGAGFVKARILGGLARPSR
jgi:chain length determinant protein EpsF